MSTRVLFVCLGNICRSPTAEGVFRQLVEQAGLSHHFEIDSAGTGDWHVGQPPDSRMTDAAQRGGYTLAGQARQVQVNDFETFDHVVAMDRDNLKNLRAICPESLHKKIGLLRAYDDDSRDLDVPDPYYGGEAGFDEVVAIVKRCSQNLLYALHAP